MPHIFSMNSQSSGQPKKRCKDLFPPHPLSPVISATATVLAFVLLHNSRFNFHCYTQREATPTQKSARKWHCDLSRLLAREVTKGIHSCKPASLNRPIGPVNRRHFVSPLTQNCVNPEILNTLQQKSSFPFLQTVVSSKKQKQTSNRWKYSTTSSLNEGSLPKWHTAKTAGAFRAPRWPRIVSVLTTQARVSNSNPKTWILKDSNVRSIWTNLTASLRQ